MKKVTKIAETANSKVKLKKVRVAAYCRVSTDSDAQLESLEAQKTHYENYITARDDWEFAGLYYEIILQSLIQFNGSTESMPLGG